MLTLPKTAEDVDPEFEYVNAVEVIGQYKTLANDVNDYQYDDPLLSIQWDDQEIQEGKEAESLIACNSQGIFLWDIQTQQLKEVFRTNEFRQNSKNNTCKAVKRDPFNQNIIAFCYGKRFEIIDLRLPLKTMIKDEISLHSSQMILDLDYNPIKVNTLATAGQDSTIRFWDLRKIDTQGKVLETRCVR